LPHLKNRWDTILPERYPTKSKMCFTVPILILCHHQRNILMAFLVQKRHCFFSERLQVEAGMDYFSARFAKQNARYAVSPAFVISFSAFAIASFNAIGFGTASMTRSIPCS